PVPHSQDIRQVASAPTPEPKHPDRARAEVKGFDNLPISLKWLADHQSREGAWRPDKFREDSQRKEAGFIGNLPRGDDDAGDEAATTRVTALALRAFAEAGYDHKAGDARSQVRTSILYLRRIQNNDGSFGGTSGLRDHAAIAGSLAATWGLSGDAVLKPIVDRAFDFLLAARVPGSGWRDTGETEPDI